MRRWLSLLLALSLLAAVPAAHAADLSVLDSDIYTLHDYEDYVSVVTKLWVSDMELRHPRFPEDKPSYTFGELIVAESEGEDVALWCWNLSCTTEKPLNMRAMTVTVGGWAFTMDLVENLQSKELEDGRHEEMSYVIMGTENADFWMLFLVDAKIREAAGTLDSWTMPLVIHGDEDLETELSSMALVDFYAAYLAMADLGLTSRLGDFQGTPAVRTDAE